MSDDFYGPYEADGKSVMISTFCMPMHPSSPCQHQVIVNGEYTTWSSVDIHIHIVKSGKKMQSHYARMKFWVNPDNTVKEKPDMDGYRDWMREQYNPVRDPTFIGWFRP